ncbi:protein kinase C-binding protein NELL2-like isoform X1 [Stylophora pistillata]|uniref:protein kinase C-binding protein NELL2-like isoform X1 n=1 Tax=Stylophora pistillata TaxID=50429 RepID=UPI000C0520D6|nr:protein kinase C-binding protein NELL2-like isoform X1 [Stylophora pistillata]
MAPSQSTSRLQLREENLEKNISHCKLLVENATTRNFVDLLLVIIILVLLGVAAPIIRGDYCERSNDVRITGDGNTSKCFVNSSCMTLTGNNHSGSCHCHVGFKWDGHVCSDIDECASGNHSCPTNSSCKNIFGSYICECSHGYAEKRHCIDLDECKLELHECDKHADCTNTMGSYNCTCQAGFYGDGRSCRSI